MNNRPERSASTIKAFGLAVVASLALSALVAASASALSFAPEKDQFTAQGGAITITDSGSTYGCAGSSTGSTPGIFSTGTSGSVTLTLKGCTLSGGIACTGPGQAAGTIVTSNLSIKPVYLDAAKTRYGLLLSPPAGKAFAAFTCWGVPVTWTGSLIGEITSPALNVSSKTFVLSFAASAQGVQRDQQIEGAGTSYHLSQTMGGSTREMAIATQETLTFEKEGKFIP
jgi:hypothetical protein